MATVESVYFIAAGWSEDVTRKFIAERDAALKLADEYVVSVGGPGSLAVNRPGSLFGFTREATHPIHGWRDVMVIGIDVPVWVPNKTTAAGRQAAAEVEKHQYPTASIYTRRLGLESLVVPDTTRGSGGEVHEVGYFVFTRPEEKIVIVVPHSVLGRSFGGRPMSNVRVPRDALRIKASEFHALKEADAEHRAAIRAGKEDEQR